MFGNLLPDRHAGLFRRPFCVPPTRTGQAPGDIGPVDLDFASALLGVSLDAILAERLPPARSKALLAQLIEEVRVVSGQEVQVTTACRPRFAHRMEWWR